MNAGRSAALFLILFVTDHSRNNLFALFNYFNTAAKVASTCC